MSIALCFFSDYIIVTVDEDSDVEIISDAASTDDVLEELDDEHSSGNFQHPFLMSCSAFFQVPPGWDFLPSLHV